MKAAGKYAAGKGLKQVITEAKKTWHKVKGKKGGSECGMKGGDPEEKETTGTEVDPMVPPPEPPVGGRRRLKTRRHRRR